MKLTQIIIVVFALTLFNYLYSQYGWIPQVTSIPSSQDLTKIQFVNSSTGYIFGGPGVIYKTTNAGINWMLSVNTGTTNFLWSGYFINAQTGWAIGNGGIIIKTTNGSLAWFTQTSGTDKLLHYIQFVNYQTGYAVGHSGAVIKTTNSGTNWLTLNCGANYNLFTTFFVNKDTGWVGGDDGLFRTLNGGPNWQFQSPIPSYYSIYFINKSTGWAGVRYGGFYKTTNTGDSWFPQVSNTSATIYSIYFVNENIGWAIGDYNTIMKTVNGGSAWFAQFTGIPGNTQILRSGYFSSSDLGWIVGFNGMVMQTTTGGAIGISSVGNTVPDGFELYQNVPNPFNPSTVISFAIPKECYVEIKLYDLTGRDIMTLLNETVAAGTYKITIDVSNLSAGTFIYSLRTADYFNSKKMVIIK